MEIAFRQIALRLKAEVPVLAMGTGLRNFGCLCDRSRDFVDPADQGRVIG